MDSRWLQAIAKAVDIELSASEADTVLPKVQRAFARRPKHEEWTAEVRRTSAKSTCFVPPAASHSCLNEAYVPVPLMFH